MNTKKKYLATIFIIFIISMLFYCGFTYADQAITENDITIDKCEIDKSGDFGGTFFPGDKINVIINTTIDTTNVIERGELVYKFQCQDGRKNYRNAIKFTVNHNDIKEAPDNEEISDVSTESIDSTKVKVNFKWAIDATTLMEDINLNNSILTTGYNVIIFYNNNEIKRINKDAYKFSLENKTFEAPQINASVKDKSYSSGWANDDVTITFPKNNSTLRKVKYIIYRLNGAENSGDTKLDILENSNSITIKKEGITTVYAKQEDSKGEQSSEAKKEIKIDKTPPEIKIGNDNDFLSAAVHVDIEDSKANSNDVSGVKTSNNSLTYFWSTEKKKV